MNQIRTRCVRCCLDVDQMFQFSTVRLINASLVLRVRVPDIYTYNCARNSSGRNRMELRKTGTASSPLTAPVAALPPASHTLPAQSSKAKGRMRAARLLCAAESGTSGQPAELLHGEKPDVCPPAARLRPPLSPLSAEQARGPRERAPSAVATPTPVPAAYSPVAPACASERCALPRQTPVPALQSDSSF